MTSGIQKLLLCLGILWVGAEAELTAQHRSSYSFSSESASLLEGILNHVVHSPLPSALLDPRFDKDLPCLFYGQEMFSNYLYMLREETFEIPQIFDQQTPSQPGFTHVLEQLQIKAYQVEAMIPAMKNTPLPSAQFALSIFNDTRDFKSFRDQYTYLHPKKLSKEEEAVVQEIYHLLTPFRSKKIASAESNPISFAPIILLEKSEENEFCKEIEQVALLFRSMDYPKVTWDLSLTYTLHCGCSQTSNQELSYMSSDINTQIASTFRTSSLNNLVFIQTGEPEVHIKEVACCVQNFEPNQIWESPEDSVQAGIQIIQNPNMQDVSSNPSPEITRPSSSPTPYPIMLGVSPVLDVRNDQRLGLGAKFQFLSPISGPLFSSGRGRILTGVFGEFRSNRWDQDSVTLRENWTGGGINFLLSSPLGTNLEWINGVQGSIGLSKNTSQMNSADEFAALNQMYLSYEFLSGLGVNLNNIQLQLKVPIFRLIHSGARPEKISSFVPDQKLSHFLLNGPSPLEFYINFRIGRSPEE